MKILIVSQYFWPENFRINDLTRELVTRGHEVTVLTGIPNYPAGKVFEEYKKNPTKYQLYEGARVYRAPMFARASGSVRLFLNYMSFVFGASVIGSWRLRREKIDVIFVFEPSPVTVGLPAIILGKIKKTPIVFWVLDLWPETLAAIGVIRSPRLLSLVGGVVAFIYNRCTLVLGQSEGFAENIAKYCADKKKIRYYPSWAEDIFLQDNVEPASEVPVAPGVFTIVFAGNVGESQDFPAILAGADLLKNEQNIRWIIVGDGRKSEWVCAEVERRGLQEKILLLGRFPVNRMPSFYAHADALLVSLKRNPVFSMTIPGKVQSYLVAGVPIVGMLDGEGAKVISRANAGLVCSAGDSAGLADAVKKMASMSDQERRQFGANGRIFAKREFDRETLISQLESFLKEARTSNDEESKVEA